jgi:hypothetical protein
LASTCTRPSTPTAPPSHDSLLLSLLLRGGGALALRGGLRSTLAICQPNQALVIYGLPGRRGYRLLKGSSSLFVPLLEDVHPLDLGNQQGNARGSGGPEVLGTGFHPVTPAHHGSWLVTGQAAWSPPAATNGRAGADALVWRGRRTEGKEPG